MHAVETSKKRALAASRRTDQRRHLLVSDRNGQILERAMFAVIKTEIIDGCFHVQGASLASVIHVDRNARNSCSARCLPRRMIITQSALPLRRNTRARQIFDRAH